MSKVVTTTVLPDVAGGSVTLGGTGDSVVVTGNDIRANVLQDAGGNAVFTSDGSGVMSGVNSGLGGAMDLITTNTFTNQASVSFTTQLTSTYDIYCFTWFDVGPATNDVNFTFNGSDDTSSWSYDITKTSTHVQLGHHGEDNSGAAYNYSAGSDLAQSTAYQNLTGGLGNLGDESCVGTLWLFAPSNTTYIKHFYARCQQYQHYDASVDGVTGGYFNTTAAITALDFKMTSGNFDGIIKMYGISKS